MRKTPYFAVLLTVLALFGSIGRVVAGTPSPTHFSVLISPSTAHPGEIVTATVKAAIDTGWHMYSSEPLATATGPSPTSIVSLGAWTAVGPTTENTPIHVHDPNFDMEVAYHERSAVFSRQFRVPNAGKPESGGPIALVLHYQTCNDRICLPPTNTTLPASVTVTAGPVRAQYAKPRSNNSPPPLGSNSHSTPLFAFLLVAFGAGLLALITPCVFPLIPITLASFVKQADGNRAKLMRMATGYAGGIIALYVIAGALVATTLGAAGANQVAANPWVNLLEFALFVLFALSFFEAISLNLPAGLSGLQSAARKRSGTAGLMLMGVAFVLASFTCTAPFIGTLLVAAAGGEKFRPLAGMFAFAVAFTSPFLLCAIFPEWISRIPKGGIWLARVKATLGFVELAAALKFLSNADQVWQWRALTQPVLLALWATIFFCAFLYLIGLLRFGIVAEIEGGARTTIPWSRRVFAGLFLAATLYCFWGIAGRPINPYVGAFLPPSGYGGVGVSQDDSLPWLSDYASAVQQARAAQKPLVIDFTGYTCTNCRLNEKNVFPRPEIQKALAGFVRVQLYTDGGVDGPKNQRLQETKFDDVALPLYAVLDPNTQAVLGTIAGVVSPSQFEAFLSNAMGKYSPTSAAATPIPQELGTNGQAAMWAPFDPAAIGHGKPTVVDFRANWCVNCKAIERTVFENPTVKPILATDFVTMRADMSSWTSAQSQAWQAQYHIDALPAVLIFDKSGKELRPQRVTGLLSVSDFLSKIAPARAN